MAEVSVVMGIFNGAHQLDATLDSVLDQQGCEFELIVVDDGSTDASSRILQARAANDPRLHVIRQSHAGLTRALMRGCEATTGEFIARQDCGDLSLPGRLQRQCHLLREHPEAALVACAVRFVGPAGEPLFETARIGLALHEGLSVLDLQRIEGPPHHGATMFRRTSYRQAGGYRAAFPVAQDIDLWLRLREVGQCIGTAEVGYQAGMAAGSISAMRRGEQIRFARLAIECARRRARGLSDYELLSQPPAANQDDPIERSNRLQHARFLYFVGSCLLRTDRPAARRYFRQALRAYPLHLKSLIRLALG